MKRRHWYFITIHECPACGGTKEYRERRFDRRPKAWEKRHRFVDVWDYCDL